MKSDRYFGMIEIIKSKKKLGTAQWQLRLFEFRHCLNRIHHIGFHTTKNPNYALVKAKRLPNCSISDGADDAWNTLESDVTKYTNMEVCKKFYATHA